MNNLPDDTSKDQWTDTDRQLILLKWVSATYALYGTYQRLIDSLQEAQSRSSDPFKPATHLGQCPVDQLAQLTFRIERQLKLFLDDLEHTAALAPPLNEKKYKKLITHTAILNELNKQAQTRLLLTTFTPA